MSAVDIIDGRGYILNVEFGGGKDGVDGKDGRDGVAPDLQIGTVKESEDDQPHVTISDEGDGKLSLNFDLVSGQDGQNGEDGGVFIPSVSQEGVISWIAPEGQNPPQSVSVKGETGATFTPEVSLGGEISWTNDKGLENPDTRSIKGPKGEKGDPFTIRETYSSYEAMNNDFNNPDIAEGSFVCIASDVSDPHNAELYVKGENSYVLITDLSGASGMRGPAGIGIGKVEFTGVETTTYKEYGVYDDTDDENLLGTFNLPKGADGHQGSDGVGIESIEQTVTSTDDNGRNEITVTLTDQTTSKFYVENGSKGSTGAQGPAGQDGQDGQDGVGIDDITVEQSTSDGQANVVKIHLSNGTEETFNVYNGRTGATGSAGTLYTNNTSAATPTAEPMSGDIRLHKISKTGNYNDLIAKPTKLSDFTNDAGYQTLQDVQTAIAGKQDRLTAGTNITISNNTISTTAEPNVQSDWNQSNASADDYIKNKPALAAIATTGSYDDLINKPAESVFSSASDLVNINNWPSIHTIEMGRKATLVYDGDGVAPTVVLQYGSPIATGKQKWNGVSGDYIKYVPLAENKEYVLEFTVTSFDFDEDGQYTEDNDMSCIFYIKAETGDDGYLLNEPQLMKSHIKDDRVLPASGVVGTAAWEPSAYVTFYPNKKVGTVQLGSHTFDVMTYNSGFMFNDVKQANGEYWLDGIQLYADINGQREQLYFTGTGHPVTIDDNGEGVLNDTGWRLIHLGQTYPAVITQGVTVGKMSITGTETRNVSFNNGLPKGIGKVANGTSDNIIAYNRDGDDVIVNTEDSSTAIDDIEVTYNMSRNKIILFSAPETTGGEQKRLVIALTRDSISGVYGVDVSVVIRVLKSESKYRTYRASDYDRIVYPY